MVGHTFISARISYGETAAADERIRSVEHGVDDELAVVEIKFGRCYLFEYGINLSIYLSTIPTSIQRIIFPSRHTTNTRLSWVILRKSYISPTPLPHPAESPGLFGKPRKKFHSQKTPSTD